MAFFQLNWNVIKSDLLSFVQNYFRTGTSSTDLNGTLIVLIPKIECPKKLSQFHPISLCSVLYKLVTKVIINRVKAFLPSIVMPTKSNFVSGC